jgi:hypothetical protein
MVVELLLQALRKSAAVVITSSGYFVRGCRPNDLDPVDICMLHGIQKATNLGFLTSRLKRF